MRAFCKQCGRRSKLTNGGKCWRCRKPPKEQGVSIQHPTDDEQEMIFDCLIKQRSLALLNASNRCLSDDPAEELAIRERMGV